MENYSKKLSIKNETNIELKKYLKLKTHWKFIKID